MEEKPDDAPDGFKTDALVRDAEKDEDTDKTEEVREELGEDDTLGGSTDGNSGTILTLDEPSVTTDSESKGLEDVIKEVSEE